MPWCHEETDKGRMSQLRGGSPHSTAGHTGAGRGRAQLGSSGRVWDCRPPPRGRGTGLGGITTLLRYGQAGEGRKASAQSLQGDTYLHRTTGTKEGMDHTEMITPKSLTFNSPNHSKWSSPFQKGTAFSSVFYHEADTVSPVTVQDSTLPAAPPSVFPNRLQKVFTRASLWQTPGTRPTHHPNIAPI